MAFFVLYYIVEEIKQVRAMGVKAYFSEGAPLGFDHIVARCIL